MARGSDTRRRGPLIWVVIAIAVVSLAYFLYGGFGGPDEVVEDDDGIDMRETVDEVIVVDETDPVAGEPETTVPAE